MSIVPVSRAFAFRVCELVEKYSVDASKSTSREEGNIDLSSNFTAPAFGPNHCNESLIVGATGEKGFDPGPLPKSRRPLSCLSPGNANYKPRN
jgi:hypothetical protein